LSVRGNLNPRNGPEECATPEIPAMLCGTQVDTLGYRLAVTFDWVVEPVRWHTPSWPTE